MLGERMNRDAGSGGGDGGRRSSRDEGVWVGLVLLLGALGGLIAWWVQILGSYPASPAGGDLARFWYVSGVGIWWVAAVLVPAWIAIIGASVIGVIVSIVRGRSRVGATGSTPALDASTPSDGSR